jgi:hypothetical protein
VACTIFATVRPAIAAVVARPIESNRRNRNPSVAPAAASRRDEYT